MRGLWKIVAVSVIVLAIGCATALGVAARGGSAVGDSGYGQYGTKADCRPYESKAQWKRDKLRGLCPRPARKHKH